MSGENLPVYSTAVYLSVMISMIFYRDSSVALGTKMASTMVASPPIRGILLNAISHANELFINYVIIIESCYVTWLLIIVPVFFKE